MAKKVDSKKMAETLIQFCNVVAPWCQENNFTLHQAFEESRNTDIAKYEIISYLWSTYAGKLYLRSCFRFRGKLR